MRKPMIEEEIAITRIVVEKEEELDKEENLIKLRMTE